MVIFFPISEADTPQVTPYVKELLYMLKNDVRQKSLITKVDKLAKSPKFRHAPAFAGAGSAKAGIQNYLKTLDSRPLPTKGQARGNDAKGRFKTFYGAINVRKR